MKKVAILTSGGDCSGMNPAIKSLTMGLIKNNYEVIGIVEGYKGLLEENFIKLDLNFVNDLDYKGGTALKTARCLEFPNLDIQKKAHQILEKHGIDILIVIGGDGSFRGAKALSLLGTKVIGIPATIDNDLGYTDFTIGFDTCVNVCLDQIANCKDTMYSHNRVCVIETMGRHCGEIGLSVGIGCGAKYIIVPEDKFNYKKIVNKLKNVSEKTYIIVLTEGITNIKDFTKSLSNDLNLEVKGQVLGYVQRGGIPSSFDRILAYKMGYHALKLIEEDNLNRVIGVKNDKIFDMEILHAVNTKKTLNRKLNVIKDNLING